MAEAVRWGKRGARVNTISPGIIITPLANDELKGPRGAGYRRMIEVVAAERAGTPDEVATVGALLMGPDGAFITGSDFLMDGGVTAAYWFGELAHSAATRTRCLAGKSNAKRPDSLARQPTSNDLRKLAFGCRAVLEAEFR